MRLLRLGWSVGVAVALVGSILVSNDSAHTFRLAGDTACKADVVSVLRRQVAVVFGVEEVQEFGRLGLHHHVCGVRLSWAHHVDRLVVRAERHRPIPAGQN